MLYKYFIWESVDVVGKLTFGALKYKKLTID